MVDHYYRWSGNDAYLSLHEIDPPVFGEFDTRMAVTDTIVAIEGYTIEVEMPGLVTATNSGKLQGNKVSWNFEASSILIRDFEMFVKSRVINYWAFILSGIILLTLVIFLVVKILK